MHVIKFTETDFCKTLDVIFTLICKIIQTEKPKSSPEYFSYLDYNAYKMDNYDNKVLPIYQR